jgi:hypothetical protein
MLPSFGLPGNRLAHALGAVRRHLLAKPLAPPAVPLTRPSLSQLAQPTADLPPLVANCPVARKYLDLLGALDWDHFPERPTNHPWPGPTPMPRAPYVAAYLVKLNEGLRSMGHLRRYLLEHPALVWTLGFPLRPDPATRHDFDLERALPSRRQLGRVLRDLDHAAALFLLDATVQLIGRALPPGTHFADVIAGDTKHILAWVKENNPKQYVADRYNQDKQPKGDPDCKLGCKRRHNRGAGDGGDSTTSGSTPLTPAVPATPTTNPTPASQTTVGEFHWGYASGVIATKVPDWGEFVLAELTQPFDKSDVSYFFPLMQQVEQRLGRRPRYGAFDPAYDAFYVYQYFHEAGGCAAVPLAEKGGRKSRAFSPDGLPLCAANLPMPLKFAFTDRTSTLVVHERGKYVCPLHHPTLCAEAPATTAPGGAGCPVNHANWPKGGCTAMMPTCAGTRIRYQLDRDSAAFKEVYKQRTADERINSQALALGIERPYLRRASAIANQNTLIYVLINLRALQRIRRRKEQLAHQPKQPD